MGFSQSSDKVISGIPIEDKKYRLFQIVFDNDHAEIVKLLIKAGAK